jgi:hypothetical protein
MAEDKKTLTTIITATTMRSLVRKFIGPLLSRAKGVLECPLAENRLPHAPFHNPFHSEENGRSMRTYYGTILFLRLEM